MQHWHRLPIYALGEAVGSPSLEVFSAQVDKGMADRAVETVPL